MHVLAIDLGTESARAAVYTVDGQLVSDDAKGYVTTFLHPGWAEQNPHHWLEAALSAGAGAVSKAGITELAGIAVATTASSVVFLDANHQPVREGILWMDTRSHREATETGASANPRMAYVGGVNSPEWLVPKAMWVARHEPEVYRGARFIGEAVDYLSWALTGIWTGSNLNATCKWNYDPRAGSLPEDLYDEFGVPDLATKLPTRIQPVGEVIGPVTSQVAEALGIRNTPIVATGGIDAHVALIGLRGLSKAAVSIAAGTSNAFIAETDNEFHSPEIWGPYPDALTPGRWLAEGGQLSAGSALTWVSEKMLGYTRDQLPELWRAIADKPPASHGLMVLDDFMGNRTPRRDATLRGGVLGLSLSTTPEEIYHATIESVAFGTKEVLDSFERAGIDVSDLYFSGGIAKNPLWLHTTADVVGYPIHSVSSNNLTLLACAATAVVGAGAVSGFEEAEKVFSPTFNTVEPRADAHRVLTDAFKDFIDAKNANVDVFHRLASGESS